MASEGLAASVSLVYISEVGDWPEFLLQLDRIFQHMSLLEIGIRAEFSALVSSQLLMTNINLHDVLGYVGC